IFLNQFKDIFVLMLLAATVISFLIGETVDAIVIAAIVILNAIVGFIQEYRSEKAMEAMRKLTSPKARVIRNGKEVLIDAREVVPGDILLLEAGDRIAADARIIEAIDLKLDEAVLTGESTPVNKTIEKIPKETKISDRKNCVFMATHVIYGRGKAVVTATGMNTEFGKIAEMVQEIEEEETPLKRKLEDFAKKLAKLIIVICIIIFALEVYELVFIEKITGGPSLIKGLVEEFMTAVALAVSAVPEGLPAVVTVSLALGARELAKKNAIIRKLSSAETLGSTTVICSDKTGTLTKGEMTVRKIFVNGEIINVSGVGYDSKGEFLKGNKQINPEKDEHLLTLLRIGVLCNNASYAEGKITGDPTEGALLVAAYKAKITKEELEKEFPRLHEIPFSSERKRMTTIHQVGKKKVAYVKGAPEIILARCTHIYEKDMIRSLSEKDKKEILKTNEEMASEALRVLAMAYREVPEKFKEDEVEDKLIFVGLMGMIDPPREEAKEANRVCVEAGIKTVMITGDHKLTAIAIAKEIGMLKEGDKVLTGEELDKMSDEEFEKIVENVRVYARVSPEHKMKIVKALKKRGHIVAMTGDGVNDAPALKQADIGIAMGITGTDVSKEAADMVLADDNFATIVNAVKGGRVIYDNIRKFVFFLLRCNFDELGIIGIFALLGLPLPLSAPMILWINLVTDGGPAIALSMEPPEEDVMKRPPRDPKQGVLYGRFASILASFFTQFFGTAGIFCLSYYIWKEPLQEAMTMAFIQATFQELATVWNCRSEKKSVFRMNPFTNKFLVIAVLASLVLTASLTIVPVFQQMFGTVALSLTDWIIVIAIGSVGFLIVPEVFYGRKIWKWV
ncbi:MAG: calcium-translocating P-type ATPase, SERCA-type, partial [Candidatus Nanoarchaeia archaeon]|nr:calcium-translocating P-type ATPase, SERCA-type [Candidatus Jingweiarchaeum tengchongense]